MLSQRAQKLKPSPTLALAAKAKELAARGHKVISLSVGEPDWDTFEIIKNAGIEAIRAGHTKYAPASGLPELKKGIAEMTSLQLGLNYRPNQVTVSAGGKMILFSALQVLVDPGDEVVIPAPYWVSYPTMVELADGEPIIINCSEKSRFKLTGDDLAKAMTSRTKLVLLNSPSNPTGEVHSREELQSLAEVLRQNPKVIVISDDIYNRLVFTGDGVAPHLLHIAPDLADRVLIVNGASKAYSMTGWRLGWGVGSPAIIEAMSNLQSQSVSCASPFTQIAALEGINNCETNLREAVATLKGRRDKIATALRAVNGIELEIPDGAFYLWPNIKRHFGKSFSGKQITGSREFAQFLLEDQLVAVVPGVEFGMDGYLRLSFVADEEQVLEAVERLKTFVASLK